MWNFEVQTPPSWTGTTRPALNGHRMWYPHDTYGWQEYILVYNSTGSSLAVGVAVDWDSGSGVAVGLAADDAAALSVAGLIQTILPTLNYGWALRKGVGQGKANAAISAATAISTQGGAGLLDDTAVTTIEHELLGWGLTSAAAQNDLFQIMVQLP